MCLLVYRLDRAMQARLQLAELQAPIRQLVPSLVSVQMRMRVLVVLLTLNGSGSAAFFIVMGAVPTVGLRWFAVHVIFMEEGVVLLSAMLVLFRPELFLWLERQLYKRYFHSIDV